MYCFYDIIESEEFDLIIFNGIKSYMEMFWVVKPCMKLWMGPNYFLLSSIKWMNLLEFMVELYI